MLLYEQYFILLLLCFCFIYLILVNVKWGKEKFDVDLDLQQPPEVFIAQLYALSSVPASRQKIMFKGRLIKVPSNISVLYGTCVL